MTSKAENAPQTIQPASSTIPYFARILVKEPKATGQVGQHFSCHVHSLPPRNGKKTDVWSKIKNVIMKYTFGRKKKKKCLFPPPPVVVITLRNLLATVVSR